MSWSTSIFCSIAVYCVSWMVVEYIRTFGKDGD
nr:MAG TPA: hypothetical protein [Caudoviricetes sp.]